MVFLLQVCGLLRLFLLSGEKKIHSSFNSSCGSSLHNAIYLMVWNSVRVEVTLYIVAVAELHYIILQFS